MSAATCRVELCLSELKETVLLIAGKKQPENAAGWTSTQHKVTQVNGMECFVTFITGFDSSLEEGMLCMLLGKFMANLTFFLHFMTHKIEFGVIENEQHLLKLI